MATARTILNFMSTGTHAARPATPTLGTGEIAIYYETDTLHMFAYVGGAWTQIDSASASPTIVQNGAAVIASHATGVTLGAAVTSGNLLIALITDQTSNPTANTGWTSLGTAAGANDDVCIMWAIAGLGSVPLTALVQPCTDTHQGHISIYEITPAASGAISFPGQWTSQNPAESAYNQKPTGGLIVGCFVTRGVTAPTSLSGTGVTADATASNAGPNRNVSNFHVTNPTQGNNTITANFAASQGGQFLAICVG